MKKFLVFLSMWFCITTFQTAVAGPTTVDELREVTVQILNFEETSGGSGTVIKVDNSGSTIITNRHVCELAENGGYIVSTKGKYAVQRILKSEDHDLCLVFAPVNLKSFASISKSTPKPGEPIRVSGHPYLLPHTVAVGHLSNSMQVTLLVDVVDCTEADWKKYENLCYWFGGIPVLREYNATSTSALIAPGNSGSAVFNSVGEIVALVFAGVGRGMSPGILVPHEYIVDFVAKSESEKWIDSSRGRKITEKAGGRKAISKEGMEILERLYNLNIFQAVVNPKLDRVHRTIFECKAGSKVCLMK